MMKENDVRVLSAEGIDAYMRHLREQERSAATISKYACDLEMVRRYFAGRGLTKEALIHWKESREICGFKRQHHDCRPQWFSQIYGMVRPDCETSENPEVLFL